MLSLKYLCKVMPFTSLDRLLDMFPDSALAFLCLLYSKKVVHKVTRERET